MEEKITKRITRRAKDPSAPKVAKGRRSLAAAVSQDDIARRAYELFEARGGIHGLLTGARRA